MKSRTARAVLVFSFISTVVAQDSGWPRQLNKEGATLILYQPQIDSWNNFKDLDWRFAFSLTPPRGKPVVGVGTMHATTDVNPENDMVVLTNLQVKSINFPSLDASSAAQMDQLARTFLPPTFSISMRRLVACAPKKETAPTVALRNDPPAIFVSNNPAVLLFVDGQPKYAPIPNTKLEFVVNTSWPVFLDRPKSQYYVLVDKQWMNAGALEGPWSPTNKLHKDMEKLPGDPQWAPLKSVIPPLPANAPAPKVFFSQLPGEVILFDGPPIYSKIPGTQLTYVTNTASNLFFHAPSQQYYYLTAGRWFRASSLQGPWTYATPNLPADFALIPPHSPASRVLESVPGTEEAKDAVLLAQIPTTMVVNPSAAAAQAKVTYIGEPKFAPIEGTSLSYATNTADKVIGVGNDYYLCLQGIWFVSASPQGPWKTATSVPQVIYTIPPTSPVYNVTYVTQTVVPGGNVQSSYTAGYLGGFIAGTAVGAIVASGSGYYYPPYIGYPAFGYPVYAPYAGTYGGAAYSTAHGAYGVTQTAYGSYGSATRAAQYNPYTGTYARGGSVSTPYGSASAAQAYNPYTGAYGAHASGSSPSSQWGSSVVSKGGQTVYGQHTTTAQGTTGSIQTSSGGKAAGASTAYGNTAVGKTASNDMYAGHDGNVYKNTGSGWQKYDNGSWSNVSKPSSSSLQGAQQRSAGGWGGASGKSAVAAPEGMNQEFQNRQRGAQSSQRFEQARGGSGGHAGGFGGRRR